MSLTEQQRFLVLNDWFYSAQGHNVSQAFASQLDGLTDILTGENLLQLGCCGDNLWLSALRYHHKWLATPIIQQAHHGLVCAVNALPLERSSIDCVVAPLTLEALSGLKSPVDEIDRVLKPMGYVVIYGINPMSLWSIWMRFKRLNCFYDRAKPVSLLAIKRAMLHRGYMQCKFATFYYIPPNVNPAWLTKLEILNEIGKMIWPCPAGFYCFVMQKYQAHEPNLLIKHIVQEKVLSPYHAPVPI